MNRKGVNEIKNAMQCNQSGEISITTEFGRSEERKQRTDRWTRGRERKIKQGMDEGDKIRLRSQGGKGDSGNGPGEEMAKLQHTQTA